MSPRALVLLAIAIPLLGRPAHATNLDAFAPKTCADLDQQLAQGSEVVATFNATSQRAVEALRVGRSAEGCPALRQALHFVERATGSLAACADADPDNHRLLTGFRDLQQQIERIGRREGCLGKPPGS